MEGSFPALLRAHYFLKYVLHLLLQNFASPNSALSIHHHRFFLLGKPSAALLQRPNQYWYRTVIEIRRIPYFVNVVCEFARDSLEMVGFE